MRLLCVCLGNICRSPMAEAVLRARLDRAGLEAHVESRGVAAWHVGNPPDARALAVADRRGYDISDCRAQKISAQDFHDFDVMLAMDDGNLERLELLRPYGSRAGIRLFHPAGHEIIDCYYGSEASFETALDLIEEAARLLVAELCEKRCTA